MSIFLKFNTWRQLRNNRGFTLIEILVVIAIISLMFMITAPRVTRVFNSQRENFAIFTGMIVKTFDDAFLHNRTNYLIIHLKSPNPDDSEIDKNDAFTRSNGITVMNIEDGKFVESKLKSLHFKEFPNSFLLEEVVLHSGEKISTGYASIPFYPQGYSDNVIIHILVNDDRQWSIRIDKHMKEPKVFEGWITHETE